MLGKLRNYPLSPQFPRRPHDRFVKKILLLLLVGLVMWGWPPGRADAADVLVFMQGGGLFTKEIKSLKERRLRRVVPQTLDYSCGAAALATVMRYHFGHGLTETDAILGMFKHGEKEKIRRRGFSMLDMKRFALQQGLKAKGYRVRDVDLLKQVNIPAITLIETNRYKHFVVIRYTDDQYVYLSDPSWGNRKMPLADFEKYWDQAILVLFGPCQGTPEGLYSETEDELLPKDQAVRYRGLLGHRFTMDAANSMIYVTHISDPTAIPLLLGPVTGFFGGN